MVVTNELALMRTGPDAVAFASWRLMDAAVKAVDVMVKLRFVIGPSAMFVPSCTALLAG